MSTVLVKPKSSASCALAGEIIEDETGLMNVNAETITVAAHFRLNDQLLHWIRTRNN